MTDGELRESDCRRRGDEDEVNAGTNRALPVEKPDALGAGDERSSLVRWSWPPFLRRGAGIAI